MTWMYTILGIALVAVALRDIFSTIWQPRGLGTLSRGLFALLWRAARRLSHGGRLLNRVGSLGLALTTVVWGGLIMVGWALIYLPHMPDGFHFDSPADVERTSEPILALYLSIVTVGTLGFGDITPEYDALRLAVPLQALLGFTIFTAAISWVLQVYPALGRRRSVARKLALLCDSRSEETLTHGDPGIATQVLSDVAEALIAVELDLSEYEETYYFRDDRTDVALAATAPCALRLRDAGLSSKSEEVRRTAAMLDLQIDKLAERLGSVLRREGTPEEIFAAYALDHRRAP